MLRTLDELGRISIPAEFIKQLDINKNDEIEMSISKDGVLLNKYTPSCIFCDTVVDLVTYRKYNICEDCRKVLAEAKNGTIFY